MDIKALLKPIILAELKRPGVSDEIHKLVNDQIHKLITDEGNRLANSDNAVAHSIGAMLMTPELEAAIEVFVDGEVDHLIETLVNRL